MSEIDVAAVDEVLSTTRAVRRRLDLTRPVDNQLLLDCIDVAEQAPTGGNLGSRRWMVVRDQQVKDQLGDLYQRTAGNLRRLLEAVGLERRARTIEPSLSDILNEEAAE